MGANQSFSNRLQFEVLSNKQNAERKIEEAEKQDFYLEECVEHPMNAKARQQLTYRPNTMSVHDYYSAMSFLESSLIHLPKRLRSDLREVYIIQLMPSADDGMPHTRPGNIICFPDISQLFSLTTLKHELWHIHQRNYQDLWLKTFQAIGWKPWKGTLPSKIEANQRFNPDTIDHPYWIFHDTWVPIPVFRDMTRPKVSEIDIWFYHVQEGYHSKKVPTDLSFYFPNLPSVAYEHPRELTAYMLSEPEKYKSSKGFQELIKQIGIISIS